MLALNISLLQKFNRPRYLRKHTTICIIYSFQVTPAAVTDIQFVKPQHIKKRGQPTTSNPLQLTSQKKQINGNTGLHQCPQIPKEKLYSCLHSLIPNAALFTIVPQLDLSATSTIQQNTHSPPSPACLQAAHSSYQQESLPHSSSSNCPSPSAL